MNKPEEQALTKIEQAFYNLRLKGIRNQDSIEQTATEEQKTIAKQKREQIIAQYKALQGKKSKNKPFEKEKQER